MKLLAFLAALLCASAANATCSAVPFTFSAGTTALSAQVNSNFSALVSCINAIDAGQISSGTLATARGGTNHGNWTTGSVVYATSSTGLSEDSTIFSYDSANRFLGVGTNAPGATIHATTGGNTDVIKAVNSSAAFTNDLVLFQSTGRGDTTAYNLLKITNTAGNALILTGARTLQFGAYGAGVLVTDGSGNVTATTTPSIAYERIVNSCNNPATTCTATCTGSKKVLGGGAISQGSAASLSSSYASSDTVWSVAYVAAPATKIDAYAVCTGVQ